MSHPLSNEKCPFVNNPFDNCYCANLTSKTIESALYFCNKNYKQCEFYIKTANNKQVANKGNN